MTADPLCTCGHPKTPFHESTLMACNACDDCNEYAPPGSLEDILGVWRDQGQFPLRNAQDVKLLVDEIHRLRAVVDVASAWFVACVVGDEDAAADDLRNAINDYQFEKARRAVERADRDHR